jgi:hypothetical protein
MNMQFGVAPISQRGSSLARWCDPPIQPQRREGRRGVTPQAKRKKNKTAETQKTQSSGAPANVGQASRLSPSSPNPDRRDACPTSRECLRTLRTTLAIAVQREQPSPFSLGLLRLCGFPGSMAVVMVLILCLSACTTKSKARAEAGRAFAAGQEQAMRQAQPKEPAVTILGQVRNHVIPWREGLTLAQAIETAVYTGFSDPKLIRLTRGPESIEISVKDLLRGASNPQVESGDVIEVLR